MKKCLIGIAAALSSWFGTLAIPLCLLLGCNIIDYATGLMAAPKRQEAVSSYKGIRGITKKVCMYLLVLIASGLDILIKYAIDSVGIDSIAINNAVIDIHFSFVFASVVAVWLVANEMISIIENMIDIGVETPPFLLPVVRHVKRQVEDSVEVKEEEHERN